jgi:hypothetical protein
METFESIEDIYIEKAKMRAKRLKRCLEAMGIEMKYGNALNLIARIYNYRDWNSFVAVSKEVSNEIQSEDEE